MKEINTLLNRDSNILFIAPTGWGKTTLLLDLIGDSERVWVYLAPLRALANEFFLRTQRIRGSVLIKSNKELNEFLQEGLSFKLLIITPELLSLKAMTFISKNSKVNYVFDEIHLFYYWGRTFRPRLLETLEEIFAKESSTLSLTATMDNEILESWKEDVQRGLDNNFVLNLGNHSLKKDPSSVTYIPKLLKKEFLLNLTQFETKFAKLIFCPYRQEVFQLAQRLEEEGFKVLKCIGGETMTFGLQLSLCPKPDFIISTSALSHGVNLPQISMVYISYELNNYDFWIQMIGRAGRRGEDFRVFTQDWKPLNIKQKLYSIVYLLFMKLKNMIYPYELRRYINQ